MKNKRLPEQYTWESKEQDRFGSVFAIVLAGLTTIAVMLYLMTLKV